jgi:hypothetical protein
VLDSGLQWHGLQSSDLSGSASVWFVDWLNVVCVQKFIVGWMGGWMDGWMNGWLDGWMDGWMGRWMYIGCIPSMYVWMDVCRVCLYIWMDGFMDVWMDGWMDGWMMDGWTNDWMDGRMNEWMDGWMNGWWMGGWTEIAWAGAERSDGWSLFIDGKR